MGLKDKGRGAGVQGCRGAGVQGCRWSGMGLAGVESNEQRSHRRNVRLPADLKEIRATSETHLAKVVAALETIRLGLLRFKTAVEEVEKASRR